MMPNFTRHSFNLNFISTLATPSNSTSFPYTLPFLHSPPPSSSSVRPTTTTFVMPETLRRRSLAASSTSSSFTPSINHNQNQNQNQNRNHNHNRNTRSIRVITRAALEETKNASPQYKFLSGMKGTLLVISLFLSVSTLFLSIVEGWTLLDALYFSVVVSTTVGYGDVTPSTAVSKIFVAVYSIISVTIIANLFQNLINRISISRSSNIISSSSLLDAAENDDYLLNALYREKIKASLRLRSSFVMFLGTCLSGILLYKYFLNESLINVIYFLCISMTTVGLGDIHPKTNIGKSFATIWLIFTSLGFANILSQIADLKIKEKEYDIAKSIFSDKISNNIFDEIDGDGDNTLTEAEYLGYIICKLGKSSPEDIRSILLKFRQLDKDASGYISKKELNL